MFGLLSGVQFMMLGDHSFRRPLRSCASDNSPAVKTVELVHDQRIHPPALPQCSDITTVQAERLSTNDCDRQPLVHTQYRAFVQSCRQPIGITQQYWIYS